MTGNSARKTPHQDKRQTSVGADAGGGDRPSAPVPALRRRKAERPRVGWIAATAILLTLLIGAGWELWRWLLLIVTLD